MRATYHWEYCLSWVSFALNDAFCQAVILLPSSSALHFEVGPAGWYFAYLFSFHTPLSSSTLNPNIWFPVLFWVPSYFTPLLFAHPLLNTFNLLSSSLICPHSSYTPLIIFPLSSFDFCSFLLLTCLKNSFEDLLFPSTMSYHGC